MLGGARNRRTYHHHECVHEVTLGEESEEVYRDESSEGTFCKYHLGLMN